MTTTSPLTQPRVEGEAAPEGVYDDYVAFVATLPCADQGKRLRRHNARAFLAAHPDLDAWMRRPTAAAGRRAAP